jgi:D-aminopeptidase
LPWLANLDASLTIAHMLQNKSGLRDQWVMAMLMGARAEQRFTLEDGNEVVRRAPASMFAPGSQSWYCNLNFELLGQIIEAVSGESFADAVTRHIFTPLKMNSSYVGVDTANPIPDDVRGYRLHNDVWEEEVNAIHWGASAGIVSTAEDLLNWAHCLQHPAAAGLPWVAKIAEAFPFNDGSAACYASGINHFRVGKRAVLTHQGALRGWRSTLLNFMDEHVSIAVFMNRTNSPQNKFTRAVAYEIAEAMGIAPLWPSRPRAVSQIKGWFVSPEQGILLQLDCDRDEHGKGQPDAPLRAQVQGGWSPLMTTSHENTFATQDQQMVIRVESEDKLWLTITDANVHTLMSRVIVDAGEETPSQFAATGNYVCAPLGSTLRFIRQAQSSGSDSVVQVVLSGIFGEGVQHKLNILSATTAWFDIARGVDESPPGRVLVLVDRKANTVELSTTLARRIVFRSA